MPSEARNGQLVDSEGILRRSEITHFETSTYHLAGFAKLSAETTRAHSQKISQFGTIFRSTQMKTASKEIRNIFEVEKNIFEVEKTTSKSVRNLFEVVQTVAMMAIFTLESVQNRQMATVV